MGLLEKIFPKKNREVNAGEYFRTFTAYAPIFSSWNGELYESELVRAAIDARSRHIAKLKVDIMGSAQPKLQTHLRQVPNSLQTWSQFLYRLNTILDMQNTAFIVPEYNNYMEQIGVVTFLPSKYELVQVNGEIWIRFSFSNGLNASEKLSNVGVMTKFHYNDDFFGSANTALDQTLSLIDIQNQGIEEAVKNASTYRFMAQVNNFAKAEDLAKERKRFTAENLRGEGGGILLFPNTYSNIQQIQQTAYTVDTSELELIRSNVERYFGVNEKVMNNTANGDELDAFFNGAIEPFAIQFSEVMTRMIFTPFEIAHGAQIIASANRLQYMTVSEKVSMSKELADRGAIMIDEIRDLFNLPPLPDGNGQHAPIRGEYYYVGEDKPQEGDTDGGNKEPGNPDDGSED